MKSSAPYAIALTLFMLLLVLLAAFYFLFQARVLPLQGSLETAESQLENLNRERTLELESLRGTRDAAEAALATAQAENVALNADLVESDQEATRAAAVGPLVAIVEPREGATVVRGQPVSLVVVVSDAAGVQSVVINVGEDRFEDQGNGELTKIVRREWQADLNGTVTLSISAVNANGTTNEPITQMLSVLEPTAVPTNTPVPTPIPQPTATPGNGG
jgi:hypothetical protein